MGCYLLCRAYIISGACKRVVIVQMRDREGFAELLRNLERFELEYSITEVPQSLYDVAQQIGCIHGACRTSNIDATTAVHHGNTGAVKTFVFDGDLLKNIHLGCDVGQPGRSGSTQKERVEIAHKGLLRTAKENFVILTVGCRNVLFGDEIRC
jgi:hypothetical protein